MDVRNVNGYITLDGGLFGFLYSCDCSRLQLNNPVARESGRFLCVSRAQLPYTQQRRETALQSRAGLLRRTKNITQGISADQVRAVQRVDLGARQVDRGREQLEMKVRGNAAG
jgi:hypothetical protein